MQSQRSRFFSSLASSTLRDAFPGCLKHTPAAQWWANSPIRRHETTLTIGRRMVGNKERAAASAASRRHKFFQPQARCFHDSTARRMPPAAPKSRDRGPKSEEDTQTDFTAMNILSNTPVPTTAVDACTDDGFALDSGLKVSDSGVLLLSGEAFKWRPWLRQGRKEGTIGAGGVGDGNKGVKSTGGRLYNQKGQFHVDKQAWGILDLVWPKPDLLVLGTGAKIVPLSPETRQHINDMGIRVEVQDTRNAAAQFNLLATERGVQQVAAALVPIAIRQ